MRSSNPKREWEEIPTDPSLDGDLDYQLVDLDVIYLEDSNKVIVLPEEEEMLREDAFMITMDDDICDLIEWV